MPKNLRSKWISLCRWFLLLLISVSASIPISVKASQTVDAVEQIQYAGAVLLLSAIVAGAITATFIPTSVDSQIKHVTLAKVFIGLTFGLFASLFVTDMYKLSDMQMLLPAYFLASIGTPLMVYAVGIAADKDTYVTLVAWLKRKFGIGG